MSEYGQWNHFNCEVQGKKTGLLFQHRLVFENIKSMPPNVQAISAQELLKEHPDIDYIFLGDNHSAFHYEKNGKHVVNPGATIRQSVNEQSYKPSVYYVNTEKEIVERIYLHDDIAMVEDGYLVEETERINHIEAFVEKLKKNEVVELDFLSNIENGLLVNKKLSKETVKMIRELCAINEEGK
jgi:DNA repair exonuclease SbcCD nuclease subunit